MTNLERLPIGDGAPEVVNAVVEVPVGSRNKYEFEPELGAMLRDRVLPGSVRYPMDYGFIPSTQAQDGDALDVLLAAYDPAFPGCVIHARPIGALHIRDSSGEERNILAVPADDPRFHDINAADDLPDQNLDEMAEFFVVYKRLEGDEDVEVLGWLEAAEAHEVIREAATAFEREGHDGE